MTRTMFSINDPTLLGRLRRLGWMMIGDQKLADILLADVLEVEKVNEDQDLDFSAENLLLQAVFHRYDEASAGKTRVSLLKNATGHLPRMTQEVLHLTTIQRLAVALLAVEGMSADEAASLSGRPASVLQSALIEATNILGEIDPTAFEPKMPGSSAQHSY